MSPAPYFGGLFPIQTDSVPHPCPLRVLTSVVWLLFVFVMLCTIIFMAHEEDLVLMLRVIYR